MTDLTRYERRMLWEARTKLGRGESLGVDLTQDVINVLDWLIATTGDGEPPAEA